MGLVHPTRRWGRFPFVLVGLAALFRRARASDFGGRAPRPRPWSCSTSSTRTSMFLGNAGTSIQEISPRDQLVSCRPRRSGEPQERAAFLVAPWLGGTRMHCHLERHTWETFTPLQQRLVPIDVTRAGWKVQVLRRFKRGGERSPPRSANPERWARERLPQIDILDGSHPPDAYPWENPAQRLADGRQLVDMTMRVDVGNLDASPLHELDLSRNLALDIGDREPVSQCPDAKPLRGQQVPVLVDQPGDIARIAGRSITIVIGDEAEMHSKPVLCVRSCKLDRCSRSRLADHDGRAGERSFGEAGDGCTNGVFGGAEIVGVQDELHRAKRSVLEPGSPRKSRARRPTAATMKNSIVT